MNTECTRIKLRLQGPDGRDVVGRFDGGEIMPSPTESWPFAVQGG